MQVELTARRSTRPANLRPVVVDTNVALDLLIFSDRAPPAAHPAGPGAWTGLPAGHAR